MPDNLHRVLKRRAARDGMSLSSYIRRELERAAECPTMREWRERTARLKPIAFEGTAAELIRKLRDAR